MEYKYSGFIPQNIAPKGAKNLVIYDSNNNKIKTIPLGKMAHPKSSKLYSFGIISDLHVVENGLAVSWNPSTKLDNALTYFENNSCVFVANCGDTSNRSFYLENVYDARQFEEYKRITDSHDLKVYDLGGNHDSYYKALIECLDKWVEYTGNGLYYSIAYENEVYIFLSQPTSSAPMSDEALQWCYEQLEANRNKRCFIFVHPYLDCGNVNNVYGNNLFRSWGAKTTAFKNLLKHYKNTILFHGHSHFMFECQEEDETTNYNESTGFKSVHVPSVSSPTYALNGERVADDTKSYGYLVDVYSDCVVLNGIDFINNKFVPLGTLKIDTTLVEIEANTFTDSTGTITTN